MKKSVRICFRTDEITAKKIEEKSASLGITKSDFIHQNISFGKITKVKQKENLVIARQLAMIGSNLNQIARYANTEKVLDFEILKSLHRIEKELGKDLS